MSSTLRSGRQAFEQAWQHAQTVEERGRAFERMAKALEERSLTREQAKFVEQIGQQVLQCGQTMTALVEQGLENKQYLLSDYYLINRYHRQAVLLYIEAIKVYIEAIKVML